MMRKDTPQSVIHKFQKRQQITPYLIMGGIILLLVIGLVLLLLWLIPAVSGGSPMGGLFATRTPTATMTFTPTATVPSPTPTITPTETTTPTITETPTPNAPQSYKVQDGDNCWDIATKFNVDLLTLLAINNFAAGTCPITEGQIIIIPAPGQSLPTATPVPSDLPRGTKINYTVQSGDSLDSIASKFNSTVEAILAANTTVITDKNKIEVGKVLVIPVNIVTPTATLAPTSTLQYPLAPTQAGTVTPMPTATP